MGRGTAGVGLAAFASAPRTSPPVVSGGGVDYRDDHWRSFDNSVNAVSFGFVATAILISMFLVMAIFERLLRSRSLAPPGGGGGEEASTGKLELPSPKMTLYLRGVSVLMPGEEVPTFLAHPAPAPAPAPAPCPPK